MSAGSSACLERCNFLINENEWDLKRTGKVESRAMEYHVVCDIAGKRRELFCCVRNMASILPMTYL